MRADKPEVQNERATGNSAADGRGHQNADQDMATSLGGKPAARGWAGATRISREGRPITVFRGAEQPLNAEHFGKSSLGKASGNPSSGLGVWFTTGKGEAQTYGKASGYNLDIRNPKLIRADELPGFDSVDEAHAYRESLRKQGYDGIIISGRHLGKQELHIVAFEPNQVIEPAGNTQFSRASVVGQTSRNSWDTLESSSFDDLVYKLQDKQIDTKRVVEAVRKVSGALADEKNVYLQEELFHGRAAARTEDFVNKELGPLLQEMRARSVDIPTLDEYLHARHAEEANALIAKRNPSMPAGSPIELRNRALVAFTLLIGARDSAIASMKLKHVDLVAGCVHQDAREVKTKFSKTFTTYFFPVGPEIHQIVAEWVSFLREDMLWGNDDPLFPATLIAVGASRQFEAAGLERANWSSAASIRKIFRDAFTQAGLPYFNPHSFRNTLVRLGESVCQSPEDFKAWSQNLGHEKVLTTFLSYGQVASPRQGAIIRGLAAPRAFDQMAGADAIAEAVILAMRNRGMDTALR